MGAGRVSSGCPPGRSWPPALSPVQTKGPTAGGREGARSPHPQPGPGGRAQGSFYPAPRRCAALWVPGPRLRTDGPPDNGPGTAAQASRAGALRDWAPASGRGSGPNRWRGAEGRRCRRTKPTADRQTEREKDGDAGGGSARLAHPQSVMRVHEPSSPPPPRRPGPPPRGSARARRCGRGLRRGGSGERPIPGAPEGLGRVAGLRDPLPRPFPGLSLAVSAAQLPPTFLDV